MMVDINTNVHLKKRKETVIRVREDGGVGNERDEEKENPF